MSFTETTTTSWFSRLKGALAKIVIGIILVLAAIYFLFWNEGRSIQTYRALVEGAGLVVSVESNAVDPANEGKLVHFSGPVSVTEIPADDTFGVSAEGAVSISRNVQMYQWVEESKSETTKNVGGSETTTTTYSYKKEWRSDYVKSAEFHQPDGHENPSLPIDNATFTVNSVTVGAFTIPGNTVASLGKETAIPMTQDDAQRVAENFATEQPIKVSQNEILIGKSATAPQVGDLKIGYTRTDVTDASFVAAQQGSSLADYKTSNGRTIFLSESGTVPAAQMFETAQTENTVITWLIRVGGLLAMFIGFASIFSIFGVVGDIIPFFGSIVRFGTSLIAFALTAVIGPIVIAIGWFAYRPLIASIVVAAGLAIAFAIVYLRKPKPAATASAA